LVLRGQLVLLGSNPSHQIVTMTEVQKISVAMTREQLISLKSAVESGEYASTSEIVREALRDWQHKRALRAEEISHLRRMWNEGQASGDAGAVDFVRLREEARARLKQTGGDAG
jgi:antitoxin ParD1/3/4